MTPAQALKTLETMTDADFETVEATDLNDADIDELITNGRRAWTGRPSLTAPGTRSPRLNFRVSQTVKDKLTQTAQQQRRRESDVAREALERYLQAT
jgi:hypothetical protein